jgi:hypothetical protein
MQARTIIDKIEIDPQTGNVGVRMRKQVVADNGAVIASEYHRTMIDAAGDPATQISLVNAHLATLGYPSVKAEDVAVLNGALAAPSIADLRTAKAQELAAKR